MSLSAQTFIASSDDRARPRSARFDPERPFLFEGLTPRFATRRVRSIFVPMRDGVRLSTDFHIPLGAQLPLPVVLVRTPYNKNNAPTAMPALLPEQGIIYAIQDVRGRHESEGEFVACSGIDRLDGFDTVEWLANQPWCNGRVGTLGSSYTGETAAKIAAMRHPAHRCGVIMFDGSYGDGQTRNGAYLQGGVSLMRMMFGWYRDFVPKVSFGPPPRVDRETWYQSPWAEAYESQPVRQPAVDYDTHLRTLPVYSLLDRSGAAPSDFAQQMRASAAPCSSFFDDQGFLTEADTFAAPHIFVTGPLERGGSSFENFRLFQTGAVSDEVARHQYLWFTPAVHSGYAQCEEDTQFGARHFGDTRRPYYQDLVAWFAHWLLDRPADIDHWPRVRYFLAGCNAWQEAGEWPPRSVEQRKLFLAHGGGLQWESPNAASSFEFVYDPADPTPSEPPGTPVDLLGGGYANRSMIEERSDVITFTTAPLDAPLALVGPVALELNVASSAPDTDFVAVLSEVDNAGRSFNITHGVARMRYRNGLDRVELMERGKTYNVAIDLWHIAIEVPAGNALRLSISSSYFPVFDRNLNTGEDNFTATEWQVAVNAIHIGGATPFGNTPSGRYVMSADATFTRSAVARLSAIEFWERYSFYTTFMLLALFASAPVARGGLGWDSAQSLRFFGVYLLAVQLTPIAGGWLADRVIGMGRSLRLGAAALMIGHSLLTVAATLPWIGLGDGTTLLDHVGRARISLAGFDASRLEGVAQGRYLAVTVCFYLSVAAVAIGNGLFKPILTVIVGRLPHANEAARTAAFTTFFLYINIGGLLSVLLGGWLAETYGWRWAFAGSALGMAIAIVTTLILDRAYIRPFAQREPERAKDVPTSPPHDRRFLISIALLLGMLVLCSSISFQSYGFISLFTAQFVARDVGGFVIPPAWFTALNPITIMVLTPLLLRLWRRGGPGSDWSTVQHMAVALLLMGIGFIPLVAATRVAVDGELASPLWLAAAIMMIAASELLYAPAALAASTRLAPAPFATLAIGLQGAAIGLGAWLSGQLGAAAFEGNKAATMGAIAVVAGLAAAALLLGRRLFKRYGL